MTETDIAPPEREMIKRKEFLDRITERSGAKKGDVRNISTATLAVIAEALTTGEDMNIPPLGKLRLVKEKQAGSRQVMTLRLVLPNNPLEAETGVAEDDAEG